jgi:hypothetical protein
MRIKSKPKPKKSWEWREVVLYTTKWYSLPILLTWLNIAAIEAWLYGGSHHWHESAFVSSNLVFGQVALIAFTIIEWAYHSEKQRYWNDGKSSYYDNKAHEILFYVPRRKDG